MGAKPKRRVTSLFRKAAASTTHQRAGPMMRGGARTGISVQMPVRALNWIVLFAIIGAVAVLLFVGIPNLMKNQKDPEVPARFNPSAPTEKPAGNK